VHPQGANEEVQKVEIKGNETKKVEYGKDSQSVTLCLY